MHVAFYTQKLISCFGMRKVIFVSIVILFVIAESRGQRQADNNDFITVDVTKSYSKMKD